MGLTLIGKILKWCISESEEELMSRYKFDVIGCHPFNTPAPITFEEWKKLQ